MAYVWFFGGQAMVVWRRVAGGAEPRDLWKLVGIVFVADVLLEHPGLYTDLFLYYGHQPFAFTRFPLWWGAVNAVVPIVVGVVVHLLRDHLHGWRALTVVALMPMTQGGVNAALGWPVWNTLNTALPWPVVWAAGGVTIALAALAVHLCVIALETDRTRVADVQPVLSSSRQARTGRSASGPPPRGAPGPSRAGTSRR